MMAILTNLQTLNTRGYKVSNNAFTFFQGVILTINRLNLSIILIYRVHSKKQLPNFDE